MLRHAEPAQANLWVLRSPLHHMQLLPTTAVTRYQACTRRVSPHLRASPAQIQVRSSGLRVPELWAWSSFRAYMYGEPSIVKIDELEPRNIKRKPEPK